MKDQSSSHAVTSLTNGNSYQYDANGNMTSRHIASGALAGDYTLSYDAENRMTEVKKNGSTIATFVYDGDGTRIKSTINSVTTSFIGSHYEVSGTTVTKYYFAGSARIAMRTNGTLYYLLSDHLGSTSLTTDASGNLISELRYTAWGSTRYSNGTTPTNYTYTGQYSNASDFGLMYYGARWYDNSLGRFAQADSIVPGGVQGYDRYAYVNNSPVNYVDPSGHCAINGDDWCYHNDGGGSSSGGDDPVGDASFSWMGSATYSGSMMKDLYLKYKGTSGWWNNYLSKEFTARDFLTLILFFELRDATGDPKAIPYLKTAATEKLTFWCAQYSGGNCAGASDNAVFNYIATRGSAWIRYERYVREGVQLVSYADRPTLTKEENPFAYPAYVTVADIVDYIYANTGGKGSQWDWGNQAGGELSMYKPGIATAPIGQVQTDVVYRGQGGIFYVLNADQSSYWAK